MRVAFDIDDTILIPSVAIQGSRVAYGGVPNFDVIAVYRFFQAQGCDMILWSGGGVDWAANWGEKFGLAPYTIRVKEKSEDIDLCFDDCVVDLARVNVRVKRINNNISRHEWNETQKRTGE